MVTLNVAQRSDAVALVAQHNPLLYVAVVVLLLVVVFALVLAKES